MHDAFKGGLIPRMQRDLDHIGQRGIAAHIFAIKKRAIGKQQGAIRCLGAHHAEELAHLAVQRRLP
jgi:hypothetical protein